MHHKERFVAPSSV